jgi:hypothetical protein
VTRLTPPADERETVPVAPVQGALALDLGLPAPLPAPAAPVLQVVAGDGPREQQRVRAWAATFAQATVEVVGGDRPVTQLLRWTSARVYADLDRRVRILARTAPVTQRRRTIRPQVQSVHVCQPRPGTAEVSVHVRHGERSRALAARLEVRHGRWTCVELEMG